MWPHDSQSSRGNASYAAPQRGTSPALACYKEVPSPPPRGIDLIGATQGPREVT